MPNRSFEHLCNWYNFAQNKNKSGIFYLTFEPMTENVHSNGHYGSFSPIMTPSDFVLDLFCRGK
jgi:hypothetical protein